jgi:Fe-S cluster biogenesis protein NfuA/nitrite reductase/ring-hydroxylating ferredoxin subunit
VAARVAGALESVRPYLGSHGGDVELLDISADGVVKLRLLGSCQGCPSSAVTLKFAVEDAIAAAAPEVTSILVEEEKSAGTPALIPVSALRLRLDQVPGAPDGSWEAVPGLADLRAGDVAGFRAGGVELLVCRTGQNVYAFRDYCPRCTGSMAGATLQRALAAPSGGGLLRCPLCRSHFDVRQAGACLEDKALHLDPLPLLVRSGVMSVAVPAGSGTA